MADRRKSQNGHRSYNLIHQIELDALRSLTPVNPSNSLQLKTQITERIRQGYYDRYEILDHIVQQIEPLYCRKPK
ncbi:hypothetical protein KKC97_08440 [bacterium]|nr:hypothetical protein [bacterium]MBU1919369.1 hypothetical protein [bacterium]